MKLTMTLRQNSLSALALILGLMTGCDSEKILDNPGLNKLAEQGATATDDDAVPSAQRQALEGRPQLTAKGLALKEAMHSEEDGLGLSAEDVLGLLGKSEGENDPICRGGWTYPQFDCFKEGRSPTCGILQDERFEDIIEYHGCTHPSFGLSGYKTYLNEHRATIFDQAHPNTNLCRNPQELDKNIMELTASAEKGCRDELMQQLRDTGRPDWKADCRHLTRLRNGRNNTEKHCHYDKGNNRTHLYWSGTAVIEEPIYQFHPADAMCGRILPARRGKVQDVVYNSCRAQEFGREPTNVCQAPWQLAWTEQSIKRSDLALVHFFWRQDTTQAANCSTCDDHPYDQPKQQVAKVACLNASLDDAIRAEHEAAARGDAASEQRAKMQQQDVVLRGRTLFESVFAEDLKQQDFLHFYNVDLALPDTNKNRTKKWITEREARSTLCQALPFSHVAKQRLAEAFAPCLALAALPDQDVKGLKRIQQQNVAIFSAIKIFGQFVRNASQPDGLSPSDRNMAQKMIATWQQQQTDRDPPLAQQDIVLIGELMKQYVQNDFLKIQR